MPRLPDELLPERANECRRIPGTRLVGFTLEGLERFVAAHPNPEAGRLVLWARRDVLGPGKKRHGR